MPPSHLLPRLETEANIWVATVRPSKAGALPRPHLVPVWFAWHEGLLYICIQSQSAKARNLAANPFVSLALEDGSKTAICEGEAVRVEGEWPTAVCAIFQRKYDWVIPEGNYDWLIAITPHKWLAW